MINLFYSNDIQVENSYIITIKGNETSEKYAKRCADSCDAVGMSYKIWDAYDGTGDTIKDPDHLKDDDIMRLIKVTDHYLTKSEVACALSHISLWAHCAKIDKPIVIFEHDAVVVKKFTTMKSYNSIVYLGGAEWAEAKWPIYDIPLHSAEGPNYHFICRAHAYAIDPTIAKNLLAHVIRYGINMPLDMFIRTDLFNISHQGLYAYDKNTDRQNITWDTTIKSRPSTGRSTKRNDKLED